MDERNSEGNMENFTENFNDVKQAEKDWLQKRRQQVGVNPDAPTIGVSFSGGGIRSASFHLGVLQALNQSNLLDKVDYLSSVSGGGYIASWFSWIRAQIPTSNNQHFRNLQVASGRGSVIDWVRTECNYLVSGNGFSSWTLMAAIIGGALLNILVILPIFLFLFYLMSLELLPVSWPEWLHLPGVSHAKGHTGFLALLIISAISILGFIVCLLAFAFNSVIHPLFGPTNNFWFRRMMGLLLASFVINLMLGVLPIITRLEEFALQYVNKGPATFIDHLTYLIPVISGIIAIVKSSGLTTTKGNKAAITIGLMLLIYGFFTWLFHLGNHTNMVNQPWFYGWLILSALLAMLTNINAVGLHNYYRGRLQEAFMPSIHPSSISNRASEETSLPHDSAPQSENADNIEQTGDLKPKSPHSFRLTELKAETGAPLHLINTTLNTTSSKKAKLSNRGGDSFILSPVYCGSESTGYRSCQAFLQGTMTLATAFATSGAAIDPDTYATRSRSVSFLLTLLNIRLGFWTRNPKEKNQRRIHYSWYRYMLCEMTGFGLNEEQEQIHLSDGGHFDNLGIYELLKRQCKIIIAGDATADAEFNLRDLGLAIQRARVDFSIEVDIDVDKFYSEREQTFKENCFLVGEIRYPDGNTGQLYYLKACLKKELTPDIYAYWRSHLSFPHQSTTDQFFDEMQFDAYRELGKQLTEDMIERTPQLSDLT